MKLHFDPNQQFQHEAINIIAIREGVLKNLEITFEHFQNLYDKTPVSFNVYDSRRVSNLRNFALNNNIQIFVINIDSFVKDENVINKTNGYIVLYTRTNRAYPLDNSGDS